MSLVDLTRGPLKRRSNLPYLLGLLIATFACDYHAIGSLAIAPLLDIDQAGFSLFAWFEHAALASGGIVQWWHAVRASSIEPPLVPALNSLILIVFPTRTGLYVVPIIAHGLVVVFAYVACRASKVSHWLSFFVATSIAMFPPLIEYSHSLLFAGPAAGFVAGALALAIFSLRSKRHHMLWLMGAYAFFGLAIASRSMVIGFLPGFVVANFVYRALQMRAKLTPRAAIANMVTAFWPSTITLAVALALYYPNAGVVASYLTGYGYGQAADRYHKGTVGFLHNVWSVVDFAIVHEVYLPAFLLITVALAIFGVRGFSAVRASRVAEFLAQESVSVMLLSFSAVGFAALASTENTGVAFALPLVGPLVIASSIIVVRAIASRQAVVLVVLLSLLYGVLALGGGIFAVFVAAPHLEDVIRVPVPGLGRVPVLSNQDSSWSYASAYGYSPTFQGAWKADLVRIAYSLSMLSGSRNNPPVVFATDDAFINFNSVREQQAELGIAVSNAGDIQPVLNVDRQPCHVAEYTVPCHSSQPIVVVETLGKSVTGDPPSYAEQLKIAGYEGAVRVVMTERLPSGSVISVLVVPGDV